MSLLTMSAQLAEGFLITVEIFVLTLLFSLPLGLIVAFGRMSGCKVIRIISKIYISIMRGTPLMLQIIVVYFAPFYVFRMQVGTGYRFPAVIVAFYGIYHFHCGDVHGGEADRSGTDQCGSAAGSRCILLYLQSRCGILHGIPGEEDILLQIGDRQEYRIWNRQTEKSS